MLSKKSIGLLSSCLWVWSTLIAVNTLPVPIGGPIPLNPAATFPDPIYANLIPVMDNHFQPPYYPGNFNSPTYLQDIYYLSNAYVMGGIAFSPFNDDIVHMSIGQNQILDGKDVFDYILGSNTFCTSTDGGATWSYGPPIEQIIPLGGTKSQIINASLGPGLSFEYAKNGAIYASGWGFSDMISNPPNLDPHGGFLFTTSLDNGATWTPLNTVLETLNAYWFLTQTYRFPGPSGTRSALQEFYTTVDPSDSNIIHAVSTLATVFPLNSINPLFLFTEAYYFRSEDGGKTFSPPVKAYSIADDPQWQGNFMDVDFGSNLQYLDFGGTVQSIDHPVVVDNNTIIIPAMFIQPRKGLNRVRSLESYLYNWGCFRSVDGGKTWCRHAGILDSSLVLPQGCYDPGFVNPIEPVVISGYECFGDFEDGVGFSRGSLATAAVSASTGRVYLLRTGHRRNGSILDVQHMGGTVLVALSSDDKGASWSPYAEVSRTPTDIEIGAQQAISLGAALSQDGWYVVAYYDFRNWTGYPGEIYDNIDPLTAPPLPMDAWLAVYRETADPRGGSTGIGLDYVGEIRLTPESFNARSICLSTIPPYRTPYITSTPEKISMAFNHKNQLFVVYSTQSPGVPGNIDVSNYKGMTTDTNGYYNLFLQRFQFPKVTNQ